ncbi:MAG: hypothetical protein ABII26_04100 [Pseudomonadota bacterium]
MMEEKEDLDRVCSPKICCKQVEVPTEDEIMALNALRRIKDRVRKLKKQLSHVSSLEEDAGGKESRGVEEEIARLKTEWKSWEEKRKEATRERMILLGHEER